MVDSAPFRPSVFETFNLVNQGDYILGITNIALNLLICIGFIAVGIFLGK